MDEAEQGPTHRRSGRRSRIVGYLASVSAGAFSLGALAIYRRGWPGTQVGDFAAGLAVALVLVSIFSVPEFLASCLVSDRVRTRNVVFYCVGASAWGASLAWFAIDILDDGSGASPWETFSSELPAVVLPGLVAGFVQWRVSERARPFKSRRRGRRIDLE